MWHKGAAEVSSGTRETIGHPQRSHAGPAMRSSEARHRRQIGMRLALSSVSPQIRQGAGNITDAKASATPRKRAPTTCNARLTAPYTSPPSRPMQTGANPMQTTFYARANRLGGRHVRGSTQRRGPARGSPVPVFPGKLCSGWPTALLLISFVAVPFHSARRRHRCSS
jgi:hypothetical protein